MRSMFILGTVMIASLIGCTGVAEKPKQTLLPINPKEADLKGPAPSMVKLQGHDGQTRAVLIISPHDFIEIMQELRDLRIWRDTVRLLLGQPTPTSETPKPELEVVPETMKTKPI